MSEPAPAAAPAAAPVEAQGKRPASAGAEPAAAKKSDTTSKGVAHLKPEFILLNENSGDTRASAPEYNDEEQSTSSRLESQPSIQQNGKKQNSKKKKRGQNKNRDNRQAREQHALCSKFVSNTDASCPFGDKCRFVHDVREYLDKKAPEIKTDFFPVCPVWKSLGYCPMGYKCCFLSSHCDLDTLELKGLCDEDGRKQLFEENHEINHIAGETKYDLIKRKFPFTKSDYILEIIDAIQQENRDSTNMSKGPEATAEEDTSKKDEEISAQADEQNNQISEKREKQREIYLKYHDTRFFAQEKKKLDLHHKKIVSPLTTVGNLPYRRLMRKLGADVTYSEMALAVPLIQGTNSEWALPKAHCSEFPGFGVQIACSKTWQAAKAAEALAANVSGVSEINLNSGCPIDLLYRQGSGSALLDNPARMIRCLNGMNYVSNDIPVTVKIRTGTREGHPIALSITKRLVMETDVAAITLHGRTRQQRYTKSADWDYVGEVADAVRVYEAEKQEDKEARDGQKLQFVGNGDCNNWEDWYKHLENKNMDSVMVARGALIKPWIFEEVDAQQYMDKSATERLEILKDYCQFAMDHWGTDQYGISQCRRYFCDFMSFYHRYVPMGICERYPVLLNERPPNWKGRNDLETLLGSTDSNDWLKLSEMFFGKVSDEFVFTPKHKSNSFATN
ncbi:unnamed protein product [Kluyveromyces dobzhanskii CBS 2104]|uniref:tRNA-dihydrouridine(47) synthase [NAD(P)(+)] n=1 Tax=Kluyveromyces dobzhanskii CBS 2104 TaxID=1427455 RepID=A0A0A8L1T1_9SACH|nr:unnamed protein product [Kluyveromyces dobzhanskii CBS 2104]